MASELCICGKRPVKDGWWFSVDAPWIPKRAKGTYHQRRKLCSKQCMITMLAIIEDLQWRLEMLGKGATTSEPIDQVGHARLQRAKIAKAKTVHRRYDDRLKDRPDLAALARCNNINGPICDEDQLTSDENKVTCGRCRRILGSVAVPRKAFSDDALRRISREIAGKVRS